MTTGYRTGVVSGRDRGLRAAEAFDHSATNAALRACCVVDRICWRAPCLRPFDDRPPLTRLLRERADLFRAAPRLIHLGYGNFRDQHLAVESQMQDLHLGHVFRDGPQRKHAWDSGWLEEAAALLAEAP